VSVEAGVGDLWRKYLGLDGAAVSIERFGLSAPAAVVFKELGITAEAVVAAAKAL
jgi:transketolase